MILYHYGYLCEAFYEIATWPGKGEEGRNQGDWAKQDVITPRDWGKKDDMLGDHGRSVSPFRLGKKGVTCIGLREKGDAIQDGRKRVIHLTLG